MSRDNRLVMLALFLWGSGEGMFIYILPLYMEQRGAAPDQVGGVLAVASLLAACAFIPGGWLADRFGSKKVMLGGWAMGGLGAVMMGLAADWRALVPGVLIYWLSAYCIPAINTYIVEASGDAPLEHTLTMTFAGYAAGSILAPFVGGQIIDVFGAPTVFIIAGVIFFLSMGIASRVGSHAAHRRPDDPARLSLAQQLHQLRTLIPFYVRMSFVFFTIWVGMTLVANYMGTLGWSVGDVNTLGGTAQAIGMTVLAIGLGRLAAGRQRRGLMLGQGLVWLAMPLMLLSTRTLRLPIVVGQFLLGGQAAVRELSNAQLAGQVNRAVRGTALGINETVDALAKSVAAGVAGLLFVVDARLPLMAALTLIPIGMGWVALSRRSPSAPEEFVALASSAAVIVEPLDE